MRKSVEKIIKTLGDRADDDIKTWFTESKLSVKELEGYLHLLKNFPEAGIKDCIKWTELCQKKQEKFYPSNIMILTVLDKQYKKTDYGGQYIAYVSTAETVEFPYIPLDTLLERIGRFEKSAFSIKSLAEFVYIGLSDDEICTLSEKASEYRQNMELLGNYDDVQYSRILTEASSAVVMSIVKGISRSDIMELFDVFMDCLTKHNDSVANNGLDRSNKTLSEIVSLYACYGSNHLIMAVYSWNGDFEKCPVYNIYKNIESHQSHPGAVDSKFFITDDEKTKAEELIRTITKTYHDNIASYSIQLGIPAYTICCRYYYWTKFGQVILSCGDTKISPNNDSSCNDRFCLRKEHNTREDESLELYFDGRVFLKSEKTRSSYRLLTLSDISRLYDTYGVVYGFVFDALMSKAAGCGLYDIYQEMKEGLAVFPPLSYSDCIGLKTKNEIMHLYKSVPDVNYNKHPISSSYLFKSALQYFRKEDRPYLTEYFRQGIYDDIVPHRGAGYSPDKWTVVFSDVRTEYIMDILTKTNGMSLNNDEHIILRDYVNDHLDRKLKLKLRRSFKKIRDIHVKMQQERIEREMCNNKNYQVKIPKKSVFQKLRRKLPKDFEWITDTKRLVNEGINMNHCVASYAPYISNDTSAIYHLCYHKKGSDYDGRPYTIEFCNNKGCYYINQIQSPYDRGCPDEVREYVKSCVDKVNRKQDKSIY